MPVVIDDLKHWFSRFLRRRRALQHFGRHPLVDTLAAHGPAPAVPANLAKGLMQVALEDTPAVFARFESRETGLLAAESAQRLSRNGPNEVAHEKPLPGWLHLLHCYKNPFNLLLSALAALSWLTQDAKATVVIGAMVVLSTVIRFVQEGRSSRAAASLKAMVSNTATVLRGPPGPGVQAQAVLPTASQHWGESPGAGVTWSAGTKSTQDASWRRFAAEYALARLPLSPPNAGADCPA